LFRFFFLQQSLPHVFSQYLSLSGFELYGTLHIGPSLQQLISAAGAGGIVARLGAPGAQPVLEAPEPGAPAAEPPGFEPGAVQPGAALVGSPSGDSVDFLRKIALEEKQRLLQRCDLFSPLPNLILF
jgi:hypothetical protein